MSLQKAAIYYSLTKPGVLYSNALTTLAGYLFASRESLDIVLGCMVLLGSTLIIASACVINNYFDRDIDSIMARTKKRALVAGTLAPRNALVFGVLLGILGCLILGLYVNVTVLTIGLIGFVDYVFLYAMFSKRKSVHGTLVGSISGAIPILAGYVAAAGFDAGAYILFLIMFLWQQPEFYSISIFRRKEYAAAGVPVMAVKKGVNHTKKEILAYTVMCALAIVSLALWSTAGYLYAAVMVPVSLYWIYVAVIGIRTTQNDAWARRMFRFSLVLLLVLCLMISIDPFVP